MITKETLTKAIEAKADEYSTSVSGPIPLHKRGLEIGFTAGANFLAEPLLVALKALEYVTERGFFDAHEELYANQHKAHEALAEIRKMIGEEG